MLNMSGPVKKLKYLKVLPYLKEKNQILTQKIDTAFRLFLTICLLQHSFHRYADYLG